MADATREFVICPSFKDHFLSPRAKRTSNIAAFSSL